MSPRASASAEISFDSFSIHVKLYPVAAEERVEFKRVHAACGKRVQQQHACADHGVVPTPAVAREHRLPDGRAVVLSDEEVKAAESDRVGSIEILECVPLDAVDSVAFAKTLFVGPDQELGVDPYAAFVAVLQTERVAAVGVHYKATRDQLVLLHAWQDRGLLLRELYFPAEMRPLDEIELPDPSGSKLHRPTFEMWSRAVERRLTRAPSRDRYTDGYSGRVNEVALRKSAAAPVAPTLVAAARERALSKMAPASPARSAGRAPAQGEERPSQQFKV